MTVNWIAAYSNSDVHVTTVDAKFATTDNGKFFCMPDWKIEKYRMFQVFAEGEVPGTKCEVLFMVFPKEDKPRENPVAGPILALHA